ncbi:MAG: DUF7065 domain-containing protein [Panacagrimonas sp.]
MQIIGGGSVIEYGPGEEGPHRIGAQTLWQESVVLVWWDLAQGIGGFHRIGQEPNRADGPHVTLWNNCWSPQHVFKRTATIPLRTSDRPANGFNCGDGTCTFEFTDHAIWRIADEGVEAELHVRDHHTPVDVYPKKGALGEDVAPNHMEVGGRVTGQFRIGGKTFDVQGLAFRDHGWGLRDWSAFVSHRWVAGVLETGDVILAVTFHSRDDALVRFGCVIREAKLTYAKSVDVVTYLEPDGLSHRGGFVDMTLSTGEALHIECRPLATGTVSWIHGIACVDTLCEIEIGGVRGICDFETTNNALRGTHQPKLAVRGIVENGLHLVA